MHTKPVLLNTPVQLEDVVASRHALHGAPPAGAGTVTTPER